MNPAAISPAPWDTDEYSRIVSVRFDNGDFVVSFADGSVVRFDPLPALPPTLNDVDWWRVASNEIEIIVPHQDGWFEIPWDVIRRATDPRYAAHWEEMALRINRDIGERVHAMRTRRGMTIDEVAERSGFLSDEIRQLERGERTSCVDLGPVLRAMGYTWEDFHAFGREVDAAEAGRQAI